MRRRLPLLIGGFIALSIFLFGMRIVYGFWRGSDIRSGTVRGTITLGVDGSLVTQAPYRCTPDFWSISNYEFPPRLRPLPDLIITTTGATGVYECVGPAGTYRLDVKGSRVRIGGWSTIVEILPRRTKTQDLVIPLPVP